MVKNTYHHALIDLCKEIKIDALSEYKFLKLKEYIIFQKIKNISLEKRIYFLLNHLLVERINYE